MVRLPFPQRLHSARSSRPLSPLSTNQSAFFTRLSASASSLMKNDEAMGGNCCCPDVARESRAFGCTSAEAFYCHGCRADCGREGNVVDVLCREGKCCYKRQEGRITTCCCNEGFTVERDFCVPKKWLCHAFQVTSNCCGADSRCACPGVHQAQPCSCTYTRLSLTCSRLRPRSAYGICLLLYLLTFHFILLHQITIVGLCNVMCFGPHPKDFVNPAMRHYQHFNKTIVETRMYKLEEAVIDTQPGAVQQR